MPFFWLRLNDLLSYQEDNGVGLDADFSSQRSRLYQPEVIETFDARGVSTTHIEIPAVFLQRGVRHLGNASETDGRGQAIPTDVATLSDDARMMLTLPDYHRQAAANNSLAMHTRRTTGFLVGGIGLIDGRRWDHVLLSTGTSTPDQFAQRVFQHGNGHYVRQISAQNLRAGQAIDLSRHITREWRERGTRDRNLFAFRRRTGPEADLPLSLTDVVRVDSWINGQAAIARVNRRPGPLELLHYNSVIRSRDTGEVHSGMVLHDPEAAQLARVRFPPAIQLGIQPQQLPEQLPDEPDAILPLRHMSVPQFLSLIPPARREW